MTVEGTPLRLQRRALRLRGRFLLLLHEGGTARAPRLLDRQSGAEFPEGAYLLLSNPLPLALGLSLEFLDALPFLLFGIWLAALDRVVAVGAGRRGSALRFVSALPALLATIRCTVCGMENKEEIRTCGSWIRGGKKVFSYLVFQLSSGCLQVLAWQKQGTAVAAAGSATAAAGTAPQY